ncbi:MAG: hypothetical protein ACOYT4_03915 [Nanoarchaeota archaeon]
MEQKFILIEKALEEGLSLNAYTLPSSKERIADLTDKNNTLVGRGVMPTLRTALFIAS